MPDDAQRTGLGLWGGTTVGELLDTVALAEELGYDARDSERAPRLADSELLGAAPESRTRTE